MAEAEAPRFLTVAEVAELARVSRMTVYRMVHAGELPAIRVGKSYRVPQAAVQEMLSDGLGSWEGTGTGR
ncbi:helix-turn-helix domain-containing protein [Occultella aeris]|jgi:excisionase family DNA binding protein|uniref:Helix-turn-helix domain protein n=2 Tax=Occultella TaxID=2828348 RepID=A0A7M4DKC3_9MICO|nr:MULTISPECIES: helix-turn-helix domain-containing protein [Occultella]MBZ2198058.1 helix-turn-helix domain-containing protein [Occultella gossypii]VZO37521.1 Helix-turn-helix domain protein [Occultella aeris]